MEILQIIWFCLLGVLLAAYFICGGFDIGAGILAGFSRDANFRSRALKAVAPFWDGNQVWLVTAAGALFAAFPKAYSALLSALYIPIILFLCLLVLRTVSVEFFYSSGNGSRFWAALAAVSGALMFFVFGDALGAMFSGCALAGARGIFAAPALCAGVLALVFALAQGAGYLSLKGESRGGGVWTAILALSYILYLASFCLWGRANYFPNVAAFAVMVAAYVPLSAAMRLSRRGRAGAAFALVSLFALLCVAGHMLAGYPYLVSPAAESEGLSIFEASSSEKTLSIMLGVALAGVPLAIGYFIYAHFVFRAKK